jgi:hypothetical protein
VYVKTDRELIMLPVAVNVRAVWPRHLWLAGGSPEKERQKKSKVSLCHWTAMFTGVPAIHAALAWMVATPFAASEGIRKFTWYPSTAPG